MPEETALFFNVLIKKTDEGFLAHCLELDLVTTSPTVEQVREDIIDVIASQVDYAFTHDNLDFLYHPAPPDVWTEFFSCRGASVEIKRSIASPGGTVPPWIIAKTCKSPNLHHQESWSRHGAKYSGNQRRPETLRHSKGRFLEITLDNPRSGRSKMARFKRLGCGN